MAINLKNIFCTHCGMAIMADAPLGSVACPHCHKVVVVTSGGKVIEFDDEGIELLKELAQLTETSISQIIKPVVRQAIEQIELSLIMRRIK